MTAREYGTTGRIGVGTPQGNPTVEAEFRRLLPAGTDFVTTRLHSNQADTADRLVEYLERLPDYLATFGGMPLDIFCFACTGSSYLVGAVREHAIVEAAEQHFGYPILTATTALRRELQRLNATRIALVAPYQDWLLTAGEKFWASQGIEVVLTRPVQTANAEDTRTIYDLTSTDALATVRNLGPLHTDALLLSGTGMATLPALSAIRAIAGVPVLTSNLALAEEAQRACTTTGGTSSCA
ncbi:MAG: aspartate/glutamate racemase family protein [Gammaproteobacteria bacterium]|nr:aspartate/glutamate racemase family protein [Gammaproteobacteria bacterium]